MEGDEGHCHAFHDEKVRLGEGSTWSDDKKRRGMAEGILYPLITLMLPLTPLLLLFLLHPSTQDSDKARIDCYPEQGSNQNACQARGCLWTEKTTGDPTNMPYCYMKANLIGYTASTGSTNQWNLNKNSGPKSPWGSDIASLKLNYKDVGNGVVNVRIEDVNARYEVDKWVNLPKKTIPSSEKLSFTVNTASDPFTFAVSRSNGRKLLDTSIGGLIFTDKFIQFATYLPSTNMYGVGEHIHPNLQHDFTRYTAWGLFARDEPPDSQGLDTKNLYGTHPFYLIMEGDGKAHGVFFYSSNAQDVITLPEPALVYRTIGGNLDITVFPGPTAHDVVQQYHNYIGLPFLPPYWGLGYQLCRYGYLSLQDMKNRVDAVRSYNIPFDVAYADIDYMARYKDFTVDSVNWAGFGDYVDQMHSWGMRNILIFDPAVEVDYDSYQRGLDAKAQFIEWERADEVMTNINSQYPLTTGTQVMLGVVWPDKHVAFPDFLDPTNQTQAWWTAEFTRMHSTVKFDGAWIDMNEPSVFGTNEDHPWYYDSDDHPDDLPLKCPTSGSDAEYDMPDYKTQAVYFFGSDTTNFLATKTLCMHGMSARRTERIYNTHNLYGWSESVATQAAVYAATGKRGAVITRSTFPSSGHYAGHWLGDNTATWQDIRSAVLGVMEFNMFGIPYVGSDVCGFNGASNEELCLRWQQLGSFHSFFRNHNSIGEPYQDPAVWPSVAAASKKANEFRYGLLPYIYSLHYQVSLKGGMVIRPLFFDFANDAQTLAIDEQFLLGPHLLVAPVIYQGATTVEAYVPTAASGSTSFYSLYDDNYGQKVPLGNSVFPAPTTYNTPVFVRSGAILPRQTPGLTTAATSTSNFNLLVVPSDAVSGASSAAGELYWDDLEGIPTDLPSAFTHTTFNFSLSSTNAQLITNVDKFTVSQPALAGLEIFNYPSSPSYSSFTLDGKPFSVNTQTSKYNKVNKNLKLVFTNPIAISSLGAHTLSWQHVSSSPLDTNRTN